MTSEIVVRPTEASEQSLPALAQQLLRTPILGHLSAEEAEALGAAHCVLIRWSAPCEKAVVVAHLARIANHWKADRSSAEWQMLFEDYWHDLQEYSATDIAEAIVSHRRNSIFFPKIAELRELCDTSRALRETQLARIRRALGV